jgi:hypothetical protein
MEARGEKDNRHIEREREREREREICKEDKRFSTPPSSDDHNTCNTSGEFFSSL